MCFSLRASILKPDTVTYAPDIKSICFANDHDFPLERVPLRARRRFPMSWRAKPLVFSSSANTVFFCPADNILSDTMIWPVFNKKLEFSPSQTQTERGSGQTQRAESREQRAGQRAPAQHTTLRSGWRAASGFPHVQKKGRPKEVLWGFCWRAAEE